ncbi:MAG: serine/threonine-protein kinase, partial [Myxococcota bacterium]
MFDETSRDVGAKGAESGGAIAAGTVLSAAWRVDHPIGAGGMATVYAATGLQGERAALKVLRSDLIEQPGALQRFLREGVIARRVEHPCMVQLLGDGTTDDGNPYMALELLDGCTIETLWRSESLSLQQVLALFVDVLDLLAVCHSQGIVHRDLKPANIFATRSSLAKVLDFGVARAKGLSEDFLRPGTAMGTPAFMAPEQAMGAWDHVDERADVFSIGATLFWLLSGVRLHAGESEAESFTLAATRRAPSLRTVAPDVPSDLIEFVDRALQWDKRARFADAGEMRETLQQIRLGLDPDDRPILSPATSAEIPVDVGPARDAHAACAQALRSLQRAWIAQLEHEPVESALDAGARTLSEAVKAEGGLTFAVLPWCLRLRGETVWAPDEPFVRVIQTMFADGARALELRPDTPARAVRQLFECWLASADRPHHDGFDSVCHMWPLEPDGIRTGVACALVGASADAVESAVAGQLTVRRFLEAAGGISERPPLPEAAPLESLLIDDAARAWIATMSAAASSDEPFVRQLVRSLCELDLSVSADVEAASLMKTVACDLLEAGRPDLLLDVSQGLVEADRRDALRAMLPPERIREMLLSVDRYEKAHPSGND